MHFWDSLVEEAADSQTEPFDIPVEFRESTIVDIIYDSYY